MFTYQIQFKQPNRVDLCTKFKTLRECKQEYFRRIKHAHCTKKQDVDEIVVRRGKKIYGYYDADFVLDNSKPVVVHNILYGR